MYPNIKKYLFPVFLVMPDDRPGKIEYFLNSYYIAETISRDVALSRLFNSIKERKPVKRNHSFRINYHQVVASIAASVILVLAFHFFMAEIKIENYSAKAKSFRLPDDSRVVLSNNSSASYPKYWWNRKVKLAGEAYFEVEKGDKFKVKTSNGVVQVLGTRFLISNSENSEQVVCYEGKVSFSNKNKHKIIRAGNSLLLSDNRKINSKAIASEYPDLAKFKKTFNNEELAEVIIPLEEFFNIKIHINQKTKKHFTGTLDTAQAETALTIICRSLNLQYSKKPNKEFLIIEKNRNYEA